MAQQFWIAALAGLLAACSNPLPTPSLFSAKPTGSPVFVGLNQETPPPRSHGTLLARASDGVEVHGYIRPGSGAATNHPTVLLFHQGGSNARGEYGPIQNWLAFEGITSIAWDTRSGGSLYGSENLTVKGLPGSEPASYCDALPDLLAAIDEAERNGWGQNGFVLWGSSYTGALIFHAAAERPDFIRGVIAFSPASGEPLQDCLAMARAPELETEMLVFQPPDEMTRETAANQRLALEALGASYVIVEDGIHGSSMLLDERTGEDMKLTRQRVADWIKRR